MDVRFFLRSHRAPRPLFSVALVPEDARDTSAAPYTATPISAGQPSNGTTATLAKTTITHIVQPTLLPERSSKALAKGSAAKAATFSDQPNQIATLTNPRLRPRV